MDEIFNDYDYTLHYRNWHDGSFEHAEKTAKGYISQLQKYLPDSKGKIVLDIGCGMGHALLAMQKLGFEAEGIDISPQQIEVCKKLNLPGTLVKNAVEFLEQRSGRYDVILMMDLLEHLPVTKQIPTLAAVYKALKPGGRVIVIAPNANSPLAARWRYIDFTHTTSFTEYSLSFALKAAGFDKVELSKQGPLARPSLRLWRKDKRVKFRKWLVRYLWAQLFKAEQPDVDIENVCFDLNLTALGFKK